MEERYLSYLLKYLISLTNKNHKTNCSNLYLKDESVALMKMMVLHVRHLIAKQVAETMVKWCCGVLFVLCCEKKQI